MIYMSRIILIFFVTFFFPVIYSQVKCHHGEQNLPKDSTCTQDPLDGTSTSGGISADPKMRPIGYDSIHWVSVKDVLNYTINFENAPEFVTANE